MQEEDVIEERDEEDGDDVDDAGAGLDEGEPVEADEERRDQREEAVAAEAQRHQVHEPDQQAAEDGRAQPPRPAVEAEERDRGRHEELGQGRLGVEVRLGRLAKVLGGVDREVDLVEDVAAGVHVGVVDLDPAHDAGRPDGHGGALGARTLGGRVADPEGGDGPAAAQEVGEDRARKPEAEGHEHEDDDRDDVEPAELQEAAKARPDERNAAVGLEFGRL